MEINNKLHSIKRSLGYIPYDRYSRKESVILRRCRIGHSHLTHSFLLKGEDPPMCIPCHAPFTVKHILLDCIDFEPVRSTFYSANNLFDLFNHVSGHNILSFLREINLFQKN